MDTLINFQRLAVFKLLLITSLTQHAILALDLSDYQIASYTNTIPESKFNHFVSYNQNVYIGATDALYQLREDFSRQQTVSTALECESGVAECPNYNKILLIDEINNRLATCWSVKGFCEARNLADISDVIYERNFPIVSPGALTTEAIIAPGPESNNTLYVAATYDEFRYLDGVYSVTQRSLTLIDTGDPHASILISRSVKFVFDFIVNYISSFTFDEKTYFVQSQVQDFEGQSTKRIYVSKISRVCHSDRDLNTYSEVLLRCQGNNSSDNYNLVQAAYVGPAGRDLVMTLGLNDTDNVYYGVFAKSASQEEDEPNNQSALCIFKLSDIEDAFISAIAGCLADGNDYKLDYLTGGKCPGFTSLSDPRTTAEALQCSADQWEHADGIVPLVSTAVIEWSDITPSSVITTTHRNHTIAFVGTMQGYMVKVHVHNDTFAREYERYSVGSSVLRDAEFEENQEDVTILTEQQLLRLQVQKCGAYTTCHKCIGVKGDVDGDPYCGWCVLERRCSKYDDCPMADVSTRWLPYNSAQCVDISIISPTDRLPITKIEQQITLTVEQLPDPLDGHTYQCVFDDYPPITTTVSGDQLMCQTPPGSMIPSIKPVNDHVAMQVYVYSTETEVKFVQRDFYFYECNTHKGCVACTNSSWACDWCIYHNKCTHDNVGACSTEDDVTSIINGQNNQGIKPRPGSDECPQLIPQNGEILLPVGVSRNIKVNGINLPDDNRVNSYTCILNIKGTEVSTMAERNGDEVTCTSRMYMYNEEVQDLDAKLTVVWNGNRRLDDIYGFKVTLYKCEVGRPDCSRCLSSSTARPELMCGWCKTGAMCTVSDNSQCRGDWISPSTDENCPAPVLLGVWPPSGPQEGNTIISVTGADLGRQFTDIILVTVGGKTCSTDGLSLEYATASSVSCRTLSGTINSEEVIAVTIQGIDGTSQESTGNVIFTYRDPSISSIEPVEGPAAGGTMVTIRGQYLDACSHINATIGSAECKMNRIDDVINGTFAMCRTTDAQVNTSESLQVYFDGALRRSTDMFTYRPNPTVMAVQPLKTIQSGGIRLTVTGSGFNLAQRPQIIMYMQDVAFKEECDVINETSTSMVCKTPNTSPTSNDTSRRKRQVKPFAEATFGFIIADVIDLLTWSEKNDVALAIFPDPEYQYEEDTIEYSRTIYIQGRYLNAGSTKDDVTVYIGEVKATINSLGETALTITLPDKYPGKQCINGNITDDPCIVIFHGNLEFFIGSINYPEPEPTLPVIIGGVSVIVFLALLVAIAIGFSLVQSKKFKKERDALILERLILLQRRVDETIHNLTTESNYEEVGPQASILLPNNVRINPEDVKIRYNELTMGRSLGHGAFGEVFLADLQTAEGRSMQVAVKSIQGEKDPSTIIKFLEEGLIMKDFNHSNVLGLIGLTFDPEGNPLVILPLMKNGDLKAFLKKSTMKTTTEQRLKFAIDATKGMAYLAGKKFVHRDLAARNCMIDGDLVVKIGDFGRSRDMEDDDYYVSQDKKAKLPVKWMAPESLDRKLYNEKTDVWSFGILLWEIFTNGAKPYRYIANRSVYDHISSGNRLPCPDGCREDVYDIMLHCWNINPKYRCTFQELTQRLSIILNIHTNATMGNQDEIEATGSSSAINRDSYLHPMTEEIGEGFETGDGKNLVNGNSDSHTNLHINATTENQYEVGATDSSSAMNRDSYLHPMDEEIAKGDDTGNGKNLVDGDTCLHPTEQHNTAVVIEMTDMS